MLFSCLHIKTISQELKNHQECKNKAKMLWSEWKIYIFGDSSTVQVENMIFGVSNYLILFEFIDLNTKYCSKVE